MLKTNARTQVGKPSPSEGMDLPIDPNVIQNNTDWCWAACVLVVLELKQIAPPAASTKWTQCLVASSVPGFTGLACCPDKPVTGGNNPCNQGLTTDEVDGLFHQDGIHSVLTPQSLANADAVIGELNKTNPVGIRIAWTAASGHMLLVYGWHRRNAKATPSFDVFDPVEGPGVIVSFGELLNYHRRGTWTHTFTNLKP
jgi:hypothetical protein